MADDDPHARLTSQKDDVLKLFRKALDDGGFSDVDISSVELFVRERTHTCPDGTPAEWKPVRRPNGTVTFQWVCK
jgi:hypothetical protein